MGDETAEVTDEIETEEQATETEEALETESTDEETTEEDGEKAETEEEESQGIEITRERKDSQPSESAKTSGFQKRINKLNSRNDAAIAEKNDATQANSILEEKNKILQIALEQAKEGKGEQLKAPNPDDFEGGRYDEKFIEKDEAFKSAKTSEEVKRLVAEATKLTTVDTQANKVALDLNQKQEEHYARSDKLGAKDYNETEDKAIEILGLDYVNHVIGNFDDSQTILYYLGKNPKEAESLKVLLDKNAIQGVAEIGRLRSEIKIKPKSKTPAADPDEELEGSIPSGKKGKRGPKGATFT